MLKIIFVIGLKKKGECQLRSHAACLEVPLENLIIFINIVSYNLREINEFSAIVTIKVKTWCKMSDKVKTTEQTI